jgi:hypothetical protein
MQESPRSMLISGLVWSRTTLRGKRDQNHTLKQKAQPKETHSLPHGRWSLGMRLIKGRQLLWRSTQAQQSQRNNKRLLVDIIV